MAKLTRIGVRRAGSIALGALLLGASAGCGSDRGERTVLEPVAPVPGAPASLQVLPLFSKIMIVGDTVPLSVIVRDAAGRPVPATDVRWVSLDTTVAVIDTAGLVSGHAHGLSQIRVSTDTLAASAWVWVRGDAISDLPITPSELRPVLGPLVSRNARPAPQSLQEYDTRYVETEQARFDEFVSCENTCFMAANHYGALRSRLMWAIRNGEPIGADATDETQHAYARGRRIVRRYLQWSKSWGYAAKPENNTGLADVEILWVLDGDTAAYNHLWASAAAFSQRDRYIDLTGPATSPRQALVPLMAISAAHRLGIPYRRPTHFSAVGFDGTPGSWKASGERIIGWMYAKEQADGGTGQLISTAHNGQEAYLFNAWMAEELLRWSANVEWNPTAFELAKRIMDHMITVYNTHHKPNGWATLPYTTNGTYAAHDLAGFYIWPSLVLWQETGEAKYYDFALSNLSATRRAYLDDMKQWNQTYSTLGQGAQALLAGAWWR